MNISGKSPAEFVLENGYLADFWVLGEHVRSKDELVKRGVRIRALIDTGANLSVVSTDLLHKVKAKKIDKFTTVGIHGIPNEVDLYSCVLSAKSFSTSKVWQREVSVVGQDIPLFPGQTRATFDATLGRDILRFLSIKLGPGGLYELKLA